MTLSPVSRLPRPSTWFVWHGHRLRSGMRVLDLACGEGRHSLAAAALGAHVTAVDRDEERLATARELAQERGFEVDWRVADLEGPWPELVAQLAPGGFLMMETFLLAQRELGWGPTSDDHLLRPGELAGLVAPLTIVHGREVLEAIDAERWRAVASVLAVKK